MRTIPLVLAVLFALPACGQQSGSPDLWASSAISKAKQRGELIVVLEAEFPPFETIDKSGELVGFDVDFARLLAKEMEIGVRFLNVKWKGITDTLPI